MNKNNNNNMNNMSIINNNINNMSNSMNMNAGCEHLPPQHQGRDSSPTPLHSTGWAHAPVLSLHPGLSRTQYRDKLGCATGEYPCPT